MNKAVENRQHDAKRTGKAASVPAVALPPRRASGSALHIYKPGQGAYVRWGTAAAAAAVVLGLAHFLREQLTRMDNQWVQYLVPVALLVVLAYGVFRMLGQSRSVVDFMIATEGEMKKVNWSTRREVLGATRVVIATVIALGVILFVVDLFFMFFFEAIGVLRIGMIAGLFGVEAE